MKETNFADFAEFLADEARKISKEYFRTPIAAEIKKDNSPVTEADRKIEQALRSVIKNNFPDHGIFGEEFGQEQTENEFVWFIDPIDGTKSFMSGRPIFGTLISLTQNGSPIVGVIDQPIIEERWIGAFGMSKFNNQVCKTRECRNISDAILACTAPEMFKSDGYQKFKAASAESRFTMYGGDCYLYGQLASGFIDVVIEQDLKPYDFIALIPVIENAGGIITDWRGNLLTANSVGDVVACGDKNLHRQVLKHLNQCL